MVGTPSKQAKIALTLNEIRNIQAASAALVAAKAMLLNTTGGSSVTAVKLNSSRLLIL
jgi:hypothetical protein